MKTQTARQIVRMVTLRLHPGSGCGDGSCVYGHPGGMQTNGGCSCLKTQNIYELRKVILELADVAKALAATFPAAESAPKDPQP